MKAYRALVAACCCGVLAAPAAALEWSVALGGDVRWFDWREHQGDEQLLMEFGPLAMPALRLRADSGVLFTSLESGWGGGLTRYDGQLQTGPAYEADAWEEIIETEWKIGWQEARGSLALGLMQRDWRRHIEGSATVSSAEERYRWRLVTLGGQVLLPRSTQWQVALTVGVPVKSRQTVYTAQYDDLHLEPGDGLFWRLSFPFRPAAHPRLTLEPYFQQQHMDESEPRLLRINGLSQNLLAYQPASVRRELGLTLRLQILGSRLPE